MSLRDKYPIADWVLSQENVIPGDMICFFCDEDQKEVVAKVLGFPSKDYRQYLSCQRIGHAHTEVINFYSTIVYKIKSAENFAQDCSCGARFTSNPKYHLPYCPLAAFQSRG